MAAVAAAAAASAIPLPFADVATLVPIQAGMLWPKEGSKAFFFEKRSKKLLLRCRGLTG